MNIELQGISFKPNDEVYVLIDGRIELQKVREVFIKWNATECNTFCKISGSNKDFYRQEDLYNSAKGLVTALESDFRNRQIDNDIARLSR